MPATVITEHTLTLYSHDSCTLTVPMGEPTEIADKFITDAVSKGCQFVPVSGAAPAEKKEVSIEAALEQIIQRGKPEDFSTLNGKPKVGPVSDIVGHKVTGREIETAWDEMDMPTITKLED